MVALLKQNQYGGFYCSECRMSTSELVDTCPFCGSIIVNWEEIGRANSDIALENPETFYLRDYVRGGGRNEG